MVNPQTYKGVIVSVSYGVFLINTTSPGIGLKMKDRKLISSMAGTQRSWIVDSLKKIKGIDW